MQHDVIEDVTSLVKPASVHRRLYDDPAIYELELERIFGAAWIYVGHKSQVKHPGDYFCAYLGRKPVVVVRGPDGKLHVLHNQCAHRGALVVALDKGRTDEFQCCYHGWTYHLDGRLKAVPLQHGYPAGFDRKARPWRCCMCPACRAIAALFSPINPLKDHLSKSGSAT